MGAGDNVGSAYVDIHVDASPGEAELDKLMAKADRDFAELGRKKAEAELTIKSAEFDKKIDEAKGKLDYFKSRRASATLDLAKTHFDEEIAAAEAELKALSKQKVTINVDAKQVRAANKATRLLSDARAMDEKHALGQASAERKLSTERSRAALDTARTRVELGRLGEEYEKLRGKQKAIEKSSRSIFSPRSVATADSESRALSRVTAEAEHVKAKIENMGGSVQGLDSRMSKNTSLFGKWLSQLSATSVRVGPLTTSIKGMAAGLGLLGPLIFDLAGGAASVIGFLGSGIAGAASVGAAGLAGFATSALGVGLIVKPLVKEFGEVKKAEEALTKAQLKYGKGSTQVKTAQEQLNHELKGVSPAARAAIKDYGKLGEEWRGLTKAAKPAVFSAFGQGIKTVQALLPTFARESVATTKVAAGAWTAWMKSLRSSGAKQALGEIMSNFRAAIPGIAAGLGEIGAMLGHIAAAASHFLPGLSHGFADWAKGLNESVGSGNSLVQSIGGMVHNMQDFGHLAQDTGSLLVHFFGAAASSGDNLSNSLDGVIKSWDKGIQTPQGKESLTSYFEESAEATKDFFSVLGGAATLLFQFSRATAPIANTLLHIATFIGDLVTAADHLVGVKTIVQGLGVALAGLWVGNKVMNIADAIGKMAAKVGLIAGPEAAATGAIEANTAALGENTAAWEANAAASGDAGAAKGLGALETGAADAGVALDGAGTSAAGFSALLAPEILVPAAAVAALVYFSTQVANNTSKFEEAAEAGQQASKELHSSINNLVTDTEHYTGTQKKQITATEETEAAGKRLNKLRKENAPLNMQLKAIEDLTAAESKQSQARTTAAVGRGAAVQEARSALTAARDRVRAAREERHAANEKIQGSAGNPTEIFGDPERSKHLAQAHNAEARALREVAVASREAAVANIPFERQTAHLGQISEATEHGLHKLAVTIGATATKKIGNFVDPQAVANVTKLGNRLTALGRGGQVKNIAVKSHGAEQTESKLKQLAKNTAKVETKRINVKGSTGSAETSLKRVSALSQKVAGTKATVHILGNADNAEQAVQRLSAHLRQVAQGKYQARLNAIDDATPKGSKARRSLEEAARGHYEARLKAIDNATAPAKKAKAAADAVNGQYRAQISAPGATQAASQINSVVSALNALHDETVTVTYKTVGRPGHAMGGPVPGFAVGGQPDQRMVQRAAESAEARAVRNSTYGAFIDKPTFLTGEEGATHPEYVIATNPAYRSSNEDYLEAAAAALNRELVPAYQKGKGANKKGKGAATPSSTPAAPAPGPKPPEMSHRSHKYIKDNHLNDHGLVLEQHQLEKQAEVAEGHYSAELGHEEAEIAAGRLANWKYSLLRGFKQTIAGDEADLEKVYPKMLNKIGSERSKAEKADESTRKELSAVGGHLGALENDYSKMEKSKTESTKEYNEKKRRKKHEIAEWKLRQKELKKARANEEKIIKEAKKAEGEIKGTLMPATADALQEAKDGAQYITDVENGTIESPYAEPVERGHPYSEPAELALVEGENAHDTEDQIKALKQGVLAAAEKEFAYAKTTPGLADDLEAANEIKSAASALEESGGGSGGGSGPTLGEQTATYNSAREALYQQFASNITGPGGSSPMYSSGAMAGSPQYAGFSSAAAPTPADSTSAAPSGTVNHVTNNFAAPPPDPHTFTKNLQFELNA